MDKILKAQILSLYNLGRCTNITCPVTNETDCWTCKFKYRCNININPSKLDKHGNPRSLKTFTNMILILQIQYKQWQQQRRKK